MRFHFTHLKAVLKIASVYSFALITAVACGKFEASNTTIKGATANGTGNVVRDGNTGGVSGTNITINKVQTVFLGVDEFDDYEWSLKIDVNHGGRNMVFDIFPKVNPFLPDAAVTTAGSIEYSAVGACTTELCSKYIIMINVRDSSNGTVGQKVQLWDLLQNNTAPIQDRTDAKFDSLSDAYRSMTGQEVPWIDGI